MHCCSLLIALVLQQKPTKGWLLLIWLQSCSYHWKNLLVAFISLFSVLFLFSLLSLLSVSLRCFQALWIKKKCTESHHTMSCLVRQACLSVYLSEERSPSSLLFPFSSLPLLSSSSPLFSLPLLPPSSPSLFSPSSSPLPLPLSPILSPPLGPDICGPGTKKVHVIFTYKGKNLLIKKDIRCKVGDVILAVEIFRTR